MTAFRHRHDRPAAWALAALLAVAIASSDRAAAGQQTERPLFLHIAMFDPDSVDVADLGPPVALPGILGVEYLDWSPDGRTLLIVSRAAGGNAGSSVAVWTAETGATRQVAPDLRRFDRPRWAPDGRALVGQGTDRAGSTGVFRIDLTTGSATRLAPGGREPQLTPDDELVFSVTPPSPEGDSTIVQRTIASGSQRDVYRGPGIATIRLSPDGQTIAAVIGDASSRTQTLVSIPVGAGDVIEVARADSGETLAETVAWTVDSQYVLYRRFTPNAPSGGALWLAPAQGPGERLLPVDAIGLPAFHRTGRHLAYVTANRLGN